MVVGLFALTASETLAANFLFARVRYDRMKAGAGSTIQVTIVPTTVATETQIKVIFGSATFGPGNTLVSTTNLPANAIALPGIGTTAVISGTSMVVNCTDLTVGTTYAFNFAVGVTVPGAGTATDTIQSLVSSTVTDQTRVTSRYISDDQVVITANVPPTFSFILSGNTDAFTTDLGASAVSLTYGIGLSVATNAARGWTGWIKSSNAALSSATTGETIPTVGTVNGTTDTCTGGADCYNLSVSVSAGTGAGSLAADTEYAGNMTTTGGTFSTIYQPFASRTGKTTGDTVLFKALASILATKAAGSDYTDTWTIVGAGNF